MSERSGKTAQVTIGLWFDEEHGEIRLSIPGQGLSTVSSRPESKRGNPHLFNKLAMGAAGAGEDRNAQLH